MAQTTIDPKQIFNIEFLGEEIGVIYNALLNQPYAQVAKLIAKIEQVVIEQQKAE